MLSPYLAPKGCFSGVPALRGYCAGVLPLLVSPAEDGRYLLIAGERRLRASRMAKLTEVPVIISDYTNQQIAEIALIENIQRHDLNPIEEAQGLRRLMQEFKLTQEQTATSS